MHTNIHALSGMRTHDPSVRASEDISCFRPRGHCDRQTKIRMFKTIILSVVLYGRETWSLALREERRLRVGCKVLSVHAVYVCIKVAIKLALAPRPLMIYCASPFD
jgi:hypothetical protein